MAKKASTSAQPIVAAPNGKRERVTSEIDDIFATKKIKLPEPVLSKSQLKKGKSKQVDPESTKVTPVAIDEKKEDLIEEEEDEEAEEWAALEAIEQAQVDARELAKSKLSTKVASTKRVVQEIIDPSTAIDSFRNGAAPSVGSSSGNGNGNSAKDGDADERFMDSRGTSASCCT